MKHHGLKQDDLVAFGNAAAGHDGVLSDPSGRLVIKPCTPAEVAFYETSAACHHEFAELIPTFMGTLNLSTPEQRHALANPNPTSINAALQAQEGTAETLDPNDPGPLHGKKLDTEQAIVLENVAAGFVKPNILDVKLGARLWDDDSKPAKRQRLDKVAGETTSGSLGFRVAGMRVWDQVKQDYKIFDKMYGRNFSESTVRQAFETYFHHDMDASKSLNEARTALVQLCEAEVKKMQAVLEAQESRMYSASILFVYEGDATALDKAFDHAMKGSGANVESVTAQNEDEDEEDDGPRIFAAKLIDFAHARWTPGQGPDENALQGIRSVVKILDELLDSKRE